MKTRFVAAALSVCLVCSSCAGYWPFRLPPRETWVAAPAPSASIDLSFETIAQTAAKTQQQGITAAWTLITPETMAGWFHGEAIQRVIQPLVLILHNGSADPYWCDPTSISPRSISPDRAARQLSSAHPLMTAVRYVKWLTLLPLSLVFVSVIEPSTGSEFPSMEEAIRRPMRSDALALQAQFMSRELPAGPIGPDETRAGILLIHPPALGDRLSIKLVNGRTHEPLVLNWNAQPTPVLHSYNTGYETVWNAVVKVATAVPSWCVVSTDKAQGRILVRRRSLVKFLGDSSPPPITITVVSVSPHQTQVTLVTLPSRRHAIWFMASTQKGSAFFDDLTIQITPKPPPETPAPPVPQPQKLPRPLRDGSSVKTF